MNRKHRPVILFGIAFALMAPYLGFVMYYSRRFPSGQWPTWFTDTMAVWFLANFLLLMLLAKRIFRGQVGEPQMAQRASSIAKIVGSYLLIVWSLLFLYGAKETVQGKLPLNRAIPAGAFLLFFIGSFGWGLYRARRGKA
jgi:uncharacterized protein YybS (DUF2232 family)